MQITDLKGGERYEADKATRLARAAANGSIDRFGVTSRPRPNATAEPPSAASALLATDLELKPPPGLHTPPDSASPHSAKGENGKALTNGVGKHEPAEEPRFQMQPLEKNRGPEITGDNPDFHLLTENEQEVCQKLKIQPKAYNVMKDAVLREALRSAGALKKKTVREICRIDTTKASRLFEFWVWSGWISKA